MGRGKKIGKNKKGKNGEKITRGSLRTLKSLRMERRAADLKEGRTIPVTCMTRAVEMASSQNVGEERSKLLFVLSLGLVPNPINPNSESKKHREGPRVRLDRPDPNTVAEARARTTHAIFEICRKRMLAPVQHIPVECHQRKPLAPRPAGVAVPLKSSKNATVIDLVSSDEDDEVKSLEMRVPTGMSGKSRQRGNVRQINKRTTIQTSSSPLSQKRAAFKPLSSQNNQSINTQPIRHPLNSSKNIAIVQRENSFVTAKRRKGFNSNSRSLHFTQRRSPRLPIIMTCHNSSLSPVVVKDDLTCGDLSDSSTTFNKWNGHLDGSVGDSSSCSDVSETDFFLPDVSSADDVDIIIID